MSTRATGVMAWRPEIPGWHLGGDDKPSWMDGALCAEVGWDIFFPERGESVAPAKRVCAACPVRAECLEYALENEERFGVWAGTTERERRKMIDARGARRLAA